MKRPLIAVTGGDKRLPIAWWFIRWALWRCGASTCHLTPDQPDSPAALDGIVISGGDDIDANLYMPDAPDIAPADPQRDAFEIECLKRAIEGGLPIIGICRGAQLLNVVLGGNLHADLRRIREHTSNRRTPFASKDLLVEPDTRLEAVLNTRKTRINSLHHQAIADLGKDLKVSGRDRDGIVQAVEHTGSHFMLGVQWHPEYLPLRKRQHRLFSALVEAARQRTD